MTATIPKGLPFDAAPGGKFPQVMAGPHMVIYDSTSNPVDGVKTGNVYKAFGDVVIVANLFQGPVEIYIQNGSVIPIGNYNMPTSWYLGTDGAGTSILSGTHFSNSPLEIHPDAGATLAFHESAGGNTFIHSNPLMKITHCKLSLGTNGSLINGVSNGNLFLREVNIISSGGQTLMTGSTNTVTALDETTIPSNMLPASMTLNYDGTSHVNSQNGNTGTQLETGTAGPAGPPGADGAAGPAGPAGTGGATYLPPSAPANSTVNVLVVDSGGNESWQPQGGYQISSFGISQGNVEIGSTVASFNWSAAFNFTPSAVSVACTNPGGVAPSTQTPSGSPTLNGTFTATFTENTPGTAITVTITVTDPAGAPHTAIASFKFLAKILWGSITPPETAGQTLWNTLNGDTTVLDASNGHHSGLSFASASGQDQVFARLSSYGTPTLTDSGGDVYTPTLIGTVGVTENGVGAVSYSFFSVGAPGLTFSWNL